MGGGGGENYDGLIFVLFFCYIIIVIVNTNNDRFPVLCNKYFSACYWRFIWCQFLPDAKENPGVGHTSQHSRH